MHPKEAVHHEHDGRVLLVAENGHGPHIPVKGRLSSEDGLRLPTTADIEVIGVHITLNMILYLVRFKNLKKLTTLLQLKTA